MKTNYLHSEIKIFNNILLNHQEIFQRIKFQTNWNNSMHSRKTVSYGVPYNYSNMNYSVIPFPSEIQEMAYIVQEFLGYTPNNCLINYYNTGSSKMGFHSDQIDILDKNSGIAIISLGNERIMRFKDKNNESLFVDFILKPNSLFFMSITIQKDWLHSILPDKSDLNNDRISLTFRKLI
ncbi:alpha-ketoglutarate-dependent dioxygenase AlkB [Flavobacterium sp. MMLR14_040]|uniref:alpha-ketoglutarate-dependent dioxygenase AlkB n=1 Tax=Flavobacterium sp. MMLR14_040 TaxID=3093843 RepID=UPI00298FEF5F|nr:alpha-ketoglutarate-dependent dioxygenase AlkB [Flavobacterium sp. MMLR14_040]MDW8850122.1 alpha-ketoglutarate-dependent dioxygenase AlkB [Flavobacterium sp. MMLR14_040]